MTKRRIIFAFLFIIWTIVVLNIGNQNSPEQFMADKLNAVEHDVIRLSNDNKGYAEGFKEQCNYIRGYEKRLSKYETVYPINCAVSSDITSH